MKPQVIPPPHAIVDPNTMVILFLDARFTCRTMLRARRFREAACGTKIAGVEEREVVGVGEHRLPMILLRDGRGGRVGEVEKPERQEDQWWED